MSHDGGGSPAENGSRFPFLRRGTGHKKYEKISYITQKPVSSTTSGSSAATSSGLPSTVNTLEVERVPKRPQGVPRLDLHSPTTEAMGGKDSGRGSAATHREPIYAPPSSRRADSGYGEYQQHISPDRSSTPVERTYVNDQDSTILQPQVEEHEEEAEDLNKTITHQNASLHSFLRNEQEAERAVARETQMSTPTRELDASLRPRIPDTTRSLSSQASDPYDEDLGGPLHSTPIHELSLDDRPVPRPRRMTTGETPILQSGSNKSSNDGSACSTRPPSSASLTTPPASFQLRVSTDDDSLRSERRVIAPNDRPLRDAFPYRSNASHPRTPLVQPSQSTQYHVEPPLRHSPDDVLRRAAMRNAARPQPAWSSSEDMQTPLRKLLPKTKDPVVKELRKQLRDTIAHMDLAIAHLHDQDKKLRQAYDYKHHGLEQREAEVARERLHLEETLARFQAEKDEWQLEQRKTLQRHKLDTNALKRREDELNQRAQQKEKEANGKTVAAQTGAAQLRVQLSGKEEEIQKLKENCEKLNGQKARADKLMQQMKANHGRDLKKKADRIVELEKLLAAKENMEPRRKPGIQPRAKSAAGGLVRRASCPDGRALHQVQPEYYAMPEEEEEEGEEQRKQVRFDLEGIQYQEIPSMADYSAYFGMTQQQAYDLPMGIVHPFVDHLSRNMYLYELRHIDGFRCGALLFKYHTNDAKWIYGPVEVYLHHKFPLIVKVSAIDLEIRITRDQVEIHRPHLEITRYNRREDRVTDTRRRRDSSGYYVVNTGVQKPFFQVIGRSDRPEEEDRAVLRRGTLAEKTESMAIVKGKDVYWNSEAIRSPDCTRWLVLAQATGTTTLRIYFQDESIDILACPAEDWILLRHKLNGQLKPCCDIGKPSRDRERAGELVAFGSSFAKLA